MNSQEAKISPDETHLAKAESPSKIFRFEGGQDDVTTPLLSTAPKVNFPEQIFVVVARRASAAAEK